VKAHTPRGCEGAEIGNQRGEGRGRGRGRGMGKMGQGGRGGHGVSHSGGQKEAVNGSGGRGVVREREDEDHEETADERRQSRRTDGDEGVEIHWNRTTGDARGEQRVGTRARGTGLEVTEDDGRGRPGRRKRKRVRRKSNIECDEVSEYRSIPLSCHQYQVCLH
jgi:hypothetical protein